MERIDREVLKRVSRSFYLSLRWLPGPMRGPVSLGYLLARASDTLADTESVPVAERVRLLEGFSAEAAGGGAGWRSGGLGDFVARQSHAGEKVLLERLPECFAVLESMGSSLEAGAVREVVATITSGQRLDLLRFDGATQDSPKALVSDEELEDYCYRVAGCVGAFWTDVGFLTLGRKFSDAAPELLKERGVTFGKALQLVNILRDYPEDLANGRCYIPGADKAAANARWLETAEDWLESGKYYASHLKSWRLRMTSVLPALVGEETLALLKAEGSPPARKLKVPRSVVRSALWQALWWPATSDR